MILLDDKFMLEELDYKPQIENTQALYKEYYMKICGFVREENCYMLTPNEIDNFVLTGGCNRVARYKSIITSAEDRIYYFKRAMGLQLIYDLSNGRNAMIKGTDRKDDICRETYASLDMLGLIQPFGV